LKEEWFVSGHLPQPASAGQYTAEGKTLLPLTYASWWRSEANRLSSIAALQPMNEETPAIPFRIVSPLDGTVAFLDPDLPGRGSRFPLEIAGSGSEMIQWDSESLDIQEDGNQHWAILRPGRHAIEARDTATGRVVSTTLVVEAL